MAIALQGTPTLYENASGTSVVIPYPSGVAAGELLVAQVSDSSATAPTTNPGGWTLAKAQDGPTSAPTVSVWYKWATGSETGSVTFATNATAGRVTGSMERWSGVDSTTPIDTAAVGANSAVSTTFVMPSITTTTANVMLVHTIGLNAASAADIVPLAGTTKISGTTGTGRRQTVCYELRTTAGATGTRTWTNTPATSLQWAGVTIALREGVVTPPASTSVSIAVPTATISVAAPVPTVTALTVSAPPPVVVVNEKARIEQLFRIDLYNKNRVWQAPVGSFVSIEGTQRFDNISDCTFKVKATHNRLGLMMQPGTRARVQLRDKTITEGPIRGQEGEGPGVSGTFSFDVEDNFRILRNFLIFQRPGESMANQSLSYRYEATGPVETVFKDIVRLNIANRSVEPIIVATDQARGGTVTAQARMAKIYNEMFPLLEAMGYGVRVSASPAGLTVDVYPVTNYPNVLSEESRIVRKWKYRREAPDVTAVVVGGENSGTSRTFMMFEDTTRQDLWGDRIEVFQDARDADDLNTYSERATETLFDGQESVSLKVTLAETKNFKFGGTDGLNVGQRVTAKVANGAVTVTDLLREIDFSWTAEDGLKLTGTIGKNLDPSAQLASSLSTIAGSLSKLKASQ